MFIKAVYSIIEPPNFIYRSITDGRYALQYYPGEWIEPVLKGSRLFVYSNLFSAVQVHGKPVIKSLPYVGITLWSCQVINAVRIDPLKGPPPNIMVKFWQVRKQGLSPYHGEGYDMFPWYYRYKDLPSGVYAAESVLLLSIMGPDDWKELPTPVFYY